jgi:hypothetical protein
MLLVIEIAGGDLLSAVSISTGASEVVDYSFVIKYWTMLCLFGTMALTFMLKYPFL